MTWPLRRPIRLLAAKRKQSCYTPYVIFFSYIISSNILSIIIFPFISHIIITSIFYFLLYTFKQFPADRLALYTSLIHRSGK
jgi:hypothetical protein